MILKTSILFEGFSKDEIDQLIEISDSKEIEIDKDDYVFNQGDIPEYMYILLEGGVQVEKIDINGKRSIVNIFREKGTVFGEVYLYIGTYYDYGCKSIENSKILAIPKEFFLADEENSLQRKMSKNMLTVLSKKAFYLNQKLLVISGFTLRQKLANYLIQGADEKEQVYLEYNREELADFIGTTRPSLSRELMNMEDDRLISVSKDKIKILNMEKLKDIS